jgi:hypothetical protein
MRTVIVSLTTVIVSLTIALLMAAALPSRQQFILLPSADLPAVDIP